MVARPRLTPDLAGRYRQVVTDTPQVAPDVPRPRVSPERTPAAAISVTARDPDALRELLRARSYAQLAQQVGVSKTYVGELGVGHRTRVSLPVASALERALGHEVGELFRLDPAASAAAEPYLR